MASISCATLPVQHRAHRTAAARADDEEVGALLLRDPLERRSGRPAPHAARFHRSCIAPRPPRGAVRRSPAPHAEGIAVERNAAGAETRKRAAAGCAAQEARVRRAVAARRRRFRHPHGGRRRTIEAPAGGPLTFKVRGGQTKGTLTALENVIAPGDGQPLHVHANEDEAWYALERELRFRLDAESFVFVPRGTPRCFQHIADHPARDPRSVHAGQHGALL